GCLHDLFPGLLAFGHKVACALRPVGLFPIIALQFAWMPIGTEWSQTEHSPRNLPAICDRPVPLASNLAEHPEATQNAEQEPKRTEVGGIGVLSNFQSCGLGTASKSSRILHRHSAPH